MQPLPMRHSFPELDKQPASASQGLAERFAQLRSRAEDIAAGGVATDLMTRWGCDLAWVLVVAQEGGTGSDMMPITFRRCCWTHAQHTGHAVYHPGCCVQRHCGVVRTSICHACVVMP